MIGDCPRCGIATIVAMRPVASEHIVDVVFCPKCNWEAVGEPRPGAIEVDHGWCVTASLPPNVTADQVLALRSIDPVLSDRPVGRLFAELRALRVLDLGPFAHEEIQSVLDRLKAVGIDGRPRVDYLG